MQFRPFLRIEISADIVLTVLLWIAKASTVKCRVEEKEVGSQEDDSYDVQDEKKDDEEISLIRSFCSNFVDQINIFLGSSELLLLHDFLIHFIYQINV